MEVDFDFLGLLIISSQKIGSKKRLKYTLMLYKVVIQGLVCLVVILLSFVHCF